jgi:DNA-binding NarL/FixJ family response regulator
MSAAEQDTNLTTGKALDTVDVGIVESDDQIRQFMSAVIGGTPGLRVACICSTGRDALWSFARNRPRSFLVSLFLRDMTGTDLIQRMRALWPGVSPILLIPENYPRLLIEALEAGAAAYLPKPCSAEELLRTIRTVHQGGAVVSSGVAKTILDYFRARGLVSRLLTERQRQVLTCMSRGFSQKAIATDLGIERATVRTHVRNILSKLHAHSSTEAIALYLNPRGAGSVIESPKPTLSRPPSIILMEASAPPLTPLRSKSINGARRNMDRERRTTDC